MSDSTQRQTKTGELGATESARDRLVMGRSGLCVLTYLYQGGTDRTQDVLAVETRGMPEVPEIAESLQRYCRGAVADYWVENGDVGGLEAYLEDVGSRFLKDRWGLRPLVTPVVTAREHGA